MTHVRLAASELHHMSHVLRLSKGDEFLGWIEETGDEFVCRLETLDGDTAIARIVGKYEAQGREAAPVTLITAIARPKVCDSIVERAVELGLKRLVFYQGARSQGRFSSSMHTERQARWSRVAAAAIKQSGGRTAALPVHCSPSLGQALAELHRDLPTFEPPSETELPHGLRLICVEPELTHAVQNRGSGGGAVAEKTERIPLLIERFGASSGLPEYPVTLQLCRENAEIFIVIGPEGGLTTDEFNVARKFGYSPVSLGPRTLKVETAVVLACGVAVLELTRGAQQG